eukprot:gene9905-20602_t
MLAIFFAVLIFILTERWTTHNASEFENRFWSFIAFALSSVFLFVTDSPFSFGGKSPEVAFAIILSFTYIIHNYDRHLRRLVLIRIPDLKRVQSLNFGGHDRLKAHEKLRQLDELMDKIDNRWLSSAFSNTFYVMKIESDIYNIFADSSPYELNSIIKERPLGLIFYKIKDHRFFNGFQRTKLLQLLAVERILELTVFSRALLLHGLQQMKLSAHVQSEEWAKNVILKTSGDDLSELKTLMDAKGDFNSMHKLVYVDIRNPTITNEILVHIQREARIQIAHMSLGTRVAKRRQQFAWRKILSDVDDTMSCSGGSFPAGIDDSFPRKVIYPGVLAFYRELDLGTARSECDEWNRNERVGNLVFLSARPHVYKDISEKHSYEKFRKLLDSNRLHTSPSLLAGSLDSGSQFLVDGSLEPLAKKKYENFIEYLALYPEFKCIFIGDNGQGDVRASEMLMENKQYEANLQRVYVHEVQPIHKTHAVKNITKSRQCPRICYFRCYIDAGLDAFRHGLIRASGLRRLAVEAIRDFEEIPEIAWRKGGARGGLRSRETRRLELRQAVIRVNGELTKIGLEAVVFPPTPCLFPKGTAVKTPMGRGVVERYRQSDGIYEVYLNWHCGQDSPTSSTRAYLTSPSLSELPMRNSSERSTIALLRSISTNIMTSTSSTATTASKSIPDKGSLVNISSAIGAVGWTPYGRGKVVRQRMFNKVVEVEVWLEWGAVGFLRPADVVLLSCPPLLLSPTASVRRTIATSPSTMSAMLLSPHTHTSSGSGSGGEVATDSRDRRQHSGAITPSASFRLEGGVPLGRRTVSLTGSEESSGSGSGSGSGGDSGDPSALSMSSQQEQKQQPGSGVKGYQRWPWTWSSSPSTRSQSQSMNRDRDRDGDQESAATAKNESQFQSSSGKDSECGCSCPPEMPPSLSLPPTASKRMRYGAASKLLAFFRKARLIAFDSIEYGYDVNFIAVFSNSYNLLIIFKEEGDKKQRRLHITVNVNIKTTILKQKYPHNRTILSGFPDHNNWTTTFDFSRCSEWSSLNEIIKN